MAMVKFRDCLASELSDLPIENGSLITCRDTGDLILDSLEGVRVPLAKGAHIVNGPVTSELFPQEGHFYYSTSDRFVCVYHDGSFQPINATLININLENIMVTKKSQASFPINPNSTGSKFYGVNGHILNVVPHILTTDKSIADLDATNFVGAGNVVFNGVTSDDGWAVKVANNSNYNWIGSANVFVIFVENYNTV